MRLLLTTELFDDWRLTKAQLSCANTWTVDGQINRDYYDRDDAEAEPQSPEDSAFSRWSSIRPVILTLIRGKRTPLSFQFLFQEPEHDEQICRIRFADGHVYLASAVSMKTFSLDKEPERAWDDALSRFLDEHGIAFMDC